MKYSNNSIDIIGEKFNKLTVIKRLYNQYSKRGALTSSWLCVCDCGNKKVTSASKLRSGHTKSCGCLQKETMKRVRRSPNTLKVGEAAFNVLYHSYRKNAANSNREFILTKEEFKKLTSDNCYYCNNPPLSISKPHKGNGHYPYNGVDRKNNDLGYVIENVVSCCKICNMSKRSLKLQEFLDHIKKIHNHLKL